MLNAGLKSNNSLDIDDFEIVNNFSDEKITKQSIINSVRNKLKMLFQASNKTISSKYYKNSLSSIFDFIKYILKTTKFESQHLSVIDIYLENLSDIILKFQSDDIDENLKIILYQDIVNLCEVLEFQFENYFDEVINDYQLILNNYDNSKGHKIINYLKKNFFDVIVFKIENIYNKINNEKLHYNKNYLLKIDALNKLNGIIDKKNGTAIIEYLNNLGNEKNTKTIYKQLLQYGLQKQQAIEYINIIENYLLEKNEFLFKTKFNENYLDNQQIGTINKTIDSLVEDIQQIKFNDLILLLGILLNGMSEEIKNANDYQDFLIKQYNNDFFQKDKIIKLLDQIFKINGYGNFFQYFFQLSEYKLIDIFVLLFKEIEKNLLIKINDYNSDILLLQVVISGFDGFLPIKRINERSKKNIEGIIKIPQIVLDELVKQDDTLKIKIQIANLLDSLFKGESEMINKFIRPQATNLLLEIVYNQGVTNELMELISNVKQIFIDNIKGENLKSLLHILESINDCVNFPKNELIQEKLNEFSENITQTEFMAIVSFFHDLIKNLMPAKFISSYGSLKGLNLTSHQYDSSNYLLQLSQDKDGIVYSSISNFLKNKGVENGKEMDFIELISKVIYGHAGNTEFIQIDTIVGLKNILSVLDNDLKGAQNILQIRGMVYYLFEDIVVSEVFDKQEKRTIINEINNIGDIGKTINYIKVKFIQKYLEKNLGKKLSEKECDLDEISLLINELPKIVKNQGLFYGIKSGKINSSFLEKLITQKIQIIKNTQNLVNKYLHPLSYDDQGVESMRYAFNIIDIKGYINPSSNSFIKLISLNPFDMLISSPLNSSIALLSELKYVLEKTNNTNNTLKMVYEIMYKRGVYNINKLIDELKIFFKQKIDQKHFELLSDFGSTYGEAYFNICKTFSKLDSKTSSGVRTLFIGKFESICKDLSTIDVYPKQGYDFFKSKISGAKLQTNNFTWLDEEGVVNINKNRLLDFGITVTNLGSEIYWNGKKFNEFIRELKKSKQTIIIGTNGNMKSILLADYIIQEIKNSKIRDITIRLLQAYNIEFISIVNENGKTKKLLSKDIGNILIGKIKVSNKNLGLIENELKKIFGNEFKFEIDYIKQLDLKLLPQYGIILDPGKNIINNL